MSKRIRKYHKFALPTLGFGLGLAILGGVIPSVANASTNINKSVSVEDSLWNISEDLGKPIGTVRHWQNNGFSGAKTRDGGFVALTGTNSVSRTDSFGNVLWTFNPSNETTKGYQSSWKGKKAVEIIQDQGLGFQNVFYVLLAPQETPETNDKTKADEAQTISYSSINSDVKKQATIVQIVENIAGFNSSSQWQTSYAVVKSIDIKPEKMVENYPETWKKAGENTSTKSSAKDGVPFFSVTQHASWYDDQTGNSGFVMPWRQYITNLGNMYAYQGKLFMFGGNGSVFNDPEALSIGLFRVDFSSENVAITGLPYAFVLSGISWFLTEQPSVDGSTGIYHSQERPIEYESKIPMGQDKTFSYVPRIAVAGISPNFDLVEGQAPSYLYLAGTITLGQSKKSQSKTNPITSASPSTSNDAIESTISVASTEIITTKNWGTNANNSKNDGWNVKWDKKSTRSLQPSGENFIASQSLSSPATSENSIDPLSIFGTPLSMAALMSFDGKTSSNPYEYTNLMFNSRYYDISIFSGFQSSRFEWRTKTQPVRADVTEFNNDSWRNNDKGEQWQIKTMIDEFVWSMQRTLLVPTLAYGHSLKSASGLTQFTDNNNNRGYSFQLGVGTISFVEPKFDVKSIVYRNPAFVMLDYDLIGDPRLGGKINSSGQTDQNNYYWLNWGVNNDGAISTDTISQPGNNLVFDNWKVEDYTASWQYSILSKQVHKSESSAIFKTKDLIKQQEETLDSKLPSKLDFSDFKGLSIALNENKNNNSNIGSIWSNEQNSRAKNLSTKSDSTSNILLSDKPLLTEFTDNTIKDSVRNGNIHLNINMSLSFITRVPNNSSTTGKVNVLIYKGGSKGSTWKYDSSNQFKNYNDSSSDKEINLLFPSTIDQAQTSFTGQLSGDKNLVNMTYDNEASSVEFEVQNAAERNNTLGSGTFTGALSNDLLQKNISDLFDFNVNVPGIGSNQTVLNKKWLPQFFDVKQQPKLDKVENSQNIDAVKLVVTNMDLVTQSMTLTAYAYNQDTGTYAFMPSSNGDGNFASISVAKFTGFKALAAWVLPVAIAVPIVVISLVIGLGLGIGLPMQKNKQMLKLGFELQNKKVDTLTTAVGGVFKKIINQTKTDNLKKTPQMLKAAGPKPATPGTAPKASTSPTAKVQGPSAARKAPGAPFTPVVKPATPTVPKAASAPVA